VATPLQKLWPATRAGKALLVGVLVWFVNWVFSGEQTLFGSAWLKTLLDLASVAALIPLVYWLYRGASRLMGRLLWRLRRRLVVTWLLIGLLPLLLLTALVVVTGYGLLTQTNVNLARRQLDVYLAQSRVAAQALGRDLRANPGELDSLLQRRADALAPIFPGLQLGVSINQQPARVVRGNSVNGGQGEVETTTEWRAPAWLAAEPEFHGLVLERDKSGRRRIAAYHFVRLNQGQHTALQMKYPLSGLCNNFSATVGVTVSPGYAYVALVRDAKGQPQLKQLTTEELANVNNADLVGVPVYAEVRDWETGRRIEGEVLRLDYAFLEPAHIWRRLQQFRTDNAVNNYVVWAMGGVAVLFGVIALAAIASAVVLTRSITGTVHYLYEGTRRVEAGDLDHEIRAVSNDQLGDLAHSFNRMIRAVRDLLRVSAEKERLDQEMKIAAQVQTRLFPRNLPTTTALDFAPGVCLPARQVSGDYYDFLEVAPGVTGLVIADVCGKGVSAALLMANLQAHLRGQVQACHEAATGVCGVSEIVTRVNRLMAASALDASFVTLCYAEFDERTMTLRYTNAGHNPPLLWRKTGEYERLDCGGTVVGLFADAFYMEAALELQPGDLFIAFTDGLIEARTPLGVEFGEERVIRILEQHAARSAEEIKQALLAAVQRWTGGHEQEDDLTLLVFKRL
jgi:sigma-B regulation protein RsbU (phosphoserine phosphatase)